MFSGGCGMTGRDVGSGLLPLLAKPRETSRYRDDSGGISWRVPAKRTGAGVTSVRGARRPSHSGFLRPDTSARRSEVVLGDQLVAVMNQATGLYAA
jgi:hypothetical protein